MYKKEEMLEELEEGEDRRNCLYEPEKYIKEQADKAEEEAWSEITTENFDKLDMDNNQGSHFFDENVSVEDMEQYEIEELDERSAEFDFELYPEEYAKNLAIEETLGNMKRDFAQNKSFSFYEGYYHKLGEKIFAKLQQAKANDPLIDNRGFEIKYFPNVKKEVVAELSKNKDQGSSFAELNRSEIENPRELDRMYSMKSTFVGLRTDDLKRKIYTELSNEADRDSARPKIQKLKYEYLADLKRTFVEDVNETRTNDSHTAKGVSVQSKIQEIKDRISGKSNDTNEISIKKMPVKSLDLMAAKAKER